LRIIASRGLSASLVGQVLVEESVVGWEELELEVVRDSKNQMITVCFIENVDAMGVHTGDSYCTAPMLTISPELQKRLQKYSYDIVEAIQVIGGTNIQFAHDPKTGRVVVIEINPRTSRSSALASKATGFPIALVSSKLAAGMTLDEIPYWREGTLEKYTPSGEYVVVKFARWAFEKFKNSVDKLGTQMRAVGEVMSIGKTYKEALQKAIRSLEIGRYGLGFAKDFHQRSLDELMNLLAEPTSERQFMMYEAIRKGASVEELYKKTFLKPWFIEQMKELVELEGRILKYKGQTLPDDLLITAKKDGFSDRYLSQLLGILEKEIRERRISLGVVEGWEPVPVSGVKNAAYYFSTYNAPDQVKVSKRPKIMVLGGGPNRIGQGIEFDYCCVHASFALREEGCESIMINSNPETVSTDYDTSDKLFFEPVTLEDVLNIIQTEKPDGVIVQFGGQTPLNLARGLEAAGVPIIGTTPDAIDRAENRDHFKEIVRKLNLNQPDNDTARDVQKALQAAGRIGYPVLVRPSYVLGGRSMEIVYDAETLSAFMERALLVSPGHPILIDKFLEDAIEIDVDAISDGDTIVVAGIMEHIEEAGIHSGDSACILPSLTISASLLELIKEQTKMLAHELNVVGLMNIQYAIKDGTLYVLEVNPRASRTIPFVSKAIGVPLAKLATKVMLGKSLKELGFTVAPEPKHISVKEAVFPFNRFSDVDILLGPEMKSTGEVMGIDHSFGLAFAKSQMAAGFKIPVKGGVFISVNDYYKDKIVPVAKSFKEMGFKIVATSGTARHLKAHGIDAQIIFKVSEGRPHLVDLIKNGDIQMVINASLGRKSSKDAYHIRRGALIYNILYTTTIAGARALCEAISAIKSEDWQVRPLQEYHRI
jgi:carbamoyl-phosphate synthase large subunit